MGLEAPQNTLRLQGCDSESQGFLAQCDFCDCDTAILLRFLSEVKSVDLPQSALERAQKVFAGIGAKGWLHWRNMELHRRKPCLPRRK